MCIAFTRNLASPGISRHFDVSSTSNCASHIDIGRIKKLHDLHDLIDGCPSPFDAHSACSSYGHPASNGWSRSCNTSQSPSPLRTLVLSHTEHFVAEGHSEVYRDNLALVQNTLREPSFGQSFDLTNNSIDNLSGEAISDEHRLPGLQQFAGQEDNLIEQYILDRSWSASPELSLDIALPPPDQLAGEIDEVRAVHGEHAYTDWYPRDLGSYSPNYANTPYSWPASPSFSSIHGDVSDAVRTPLHQFSDSYWTSQPPGEFSDFEFQLDDSYGLLVRDRSHDNQGSINEHCEEKLSLYPSNDNFPPADTELDLQPYPCSLHSCGVSEAHSVRANSISHPSNDKSLLLQDSNVSRADQGTMTAMEELINEFDYLSTALI